VKKEKNPKNSGLNMMQTKLKWFKKNVSQMKKKKQRW